MRKIILLAIIGFGFWSYYQNAPQSMPSGKGGQFQTGYHPADLDRAQPETDFRCDGRQYCSQMTSRAEAEFFVRNCPNTKMDGDHDGIPCENDSRF